MHIQAGHTYGAITCTDSPLYPLHAPTHIEMTRNFIDVHIYTLHLAQNVSHVYFVMGRAFG